MKFSIILVCIILFSCSNRCYNNFDTIIDKSPDKDTTLTISASMWQGQYEYLALRINIRRLDTLFVKDISAKPTLNDQPFFPSLQGYEMNSYYYIGKNGPFWGAYYSDTFEELPSDNRRTNKDNIYVTYTILYRSEKEIDFETFSTNITVVLVNNNGQNITCTKTYEFHGKHECHLSPH